MEAKTLPVYNVEGKEVESLDLDPAVFDGTVNLAAIYQAVNAYRAANRSGLAATKTRGEVSGGGKKPWRQKGTGRARVGSTRSPLWRHGGVVFGPHPRDFSYSIPDKIKKLALKSALNAKVKENNFIILDTVSLSQPKTKEAAKIFTNLKIKPVRENYVLMLLNAKDAKLERALRNLDFLDVNLAGMANAYDVLAHNKLITTKDGLQQLVARLKK
jgi:large subunit ribosomal protein L4